MAKLPTWLKIVLLALGVVFIGSLGFNALTNSVSSDTAGAHFIAQYGQMASQRALKEVQSAMPGLPAPLAVRYSKAFAACSGRTVVAKLDQYYLRGRYLLGSEMTPDTVLVSKDQAPLAPTEAEGEACRSQARSALAQDIDLGPATAYWAGQVRLVFVPKISRKVSAEILALPGSLADKYAETYVECTVRFIAPKLDETRVKMSYAAKEQLTEDTMFVLNKEGQPLMTKEEKDSCQSQAGVVLGVGGLKMFLDLFK